MTIKKSKRNLIPDALVILFISATAEMTHFSAQQGRAVISADSSQYFAEADALLSNDAAPNFAMRKPGYPFSLAAVTLVLGNMTWAAVLANHAMLALLPLAAYGLGFYFRGRMVGWLAAMLTLARLQTEPWGNRIMSEPLYTVLISFGVLAVCVALSRDRALRLLFVSGALMGCAWLTRGSASAVIPAAVLAIVWTCRHKLARAPVAIAIFLLPIVAAVAFECGLNGIYLDRWKPSNGTAGASFLLRMLHDQGAAIPQTAEAKHILDFLPERETHEAFTANPLDVWVARYHALRDFGLDEWQFDHLMGHVAWQAAQSEPGAFIRHTLTIAMYHLLRRSDGFGVPTVTHAVRRSPIVHPQAIRSEDSANNWYAYWGHPQMDLPESLQFVASLDAKTQERAPIGNGRIWSILRYVKSWQWCDGFLGATTFLALLAPLWTILVCPFLGIERPGFGFLVLAYVFDALMIGLLIMTNERMQFVWIVPDTTFAALLMVRLPAILCNVARKLPLMGRSLRPKPSHACE